MSTNSLSDMYTLTEWAKRTKNGDNLLIAEAMNQDNPIISDLPLVEGNGDWGHQGTVRTNLPRGSWRAINGGVPTTTSGTEKVNELIGILEDFSEIDEDIVDGSANPAQTQSDEEIAHWEGMGQRLAETLIYGSRATDPNAFNGLAVRYAALSAQCLDNALGAADSAADKTSIWILQYGLRRVHGIYPRGSQSKGLTRSPLGRQLRTLEDGSKLMKYVTQLKWKIGIFVHDTRCVMRIANVTARGVNNTTKFGFDPDMIIRALNAMPNSGTGAVIYCNGDIKSQAEIMAMRKLNVNLTMTTAFGGELPAIRGCPLKKLDCLTNTESRVVA